MRGFMTKHGRPDNPRTARVVLKDYMNGKLLYAHAPPNVSQEEYHKHTLTKVWVLGLPYRSCTLGCYIEVNLT